jgi:hypothetical protein
MVTRSSKSVILNEVKNLGRAERAHERQRPFVALRLTAQENGGLE